MIVNDSVVYVGFWSRVGATLIDMILLILITWPILYAGYGSAFFTSDEWALGGVDLLLSWILPVIAVIAFWYLKSATPGKMAISAVIVDARTGAKMSVPQCILRYLAYVPALLPLCLGVIWVGFDKRKQGWHDKLANTVVIRKESSPATFDDR